MKNNAKNKRPRGRPPTGLPKYKYTPVCSTPEINAQATIIGAGNRSLGFRLAVAAYKKEGQKP